MADVVAAPGERVWGAAYDAPEAALTALDRKEGAGFAYRRRDGRGRAATAELRPAVTYEVIDKDPRGPAGHARVRRRWCCAAPASAGCPTSGWPGSNRFSRRC